MSHVRKRRRKKVFIITGILLIIIAGAFFIGHRFLFNNIDHEDKVAIDNEVDEITRSIVEEIKRSENYALGESENNVEAERDAAIDEDPSHVIDAYRVGFDRLKTEGDVIVERLVAEVKTEYAQMKSSGKGKVDLTKLASFYLNKANAYEIGLDRSVDTLLAAMNEDLQAAGMANDEIKSNIDDLKAEYKNQKDQRRKTLMSKAKEYL